MNINKLISDYRLTLMGVAIIMVMLYHLYFKVPCDIPIISGLICLGWSGVEIFLFLSGFGLYHSIKKDDNILLFYKRRFLRIIPAYIIINIGFYFFENISIESLLLRISTLGFWIGNTNNDYFDWYIPSIIIFYLITPFLYKLLKYNRVIYIVLFCIIPFILCYVLVQNMNVNDWNIKL